LVSDSNTGA
jgi:hypothetical protein